MKLFTAIVAILILAGIGSAETYQLGSHNVSLNLSVPANYSIEPPGYSANTGMWDYELKITPNTGGTIQISTTEYSIPIYGTILLNGVAGDIIDYYTKQNKLGNIKYGTLTYKGHDAFELSCPTQKTQQEDGNFVTWPSIHTLVYQSDELTGITVLGINTREDVYREVLDSMEITKYSNQTKVKTKPQNALYTNKPYIGPTSAYAGAGQGAKPGLEDKNFLKNA
jgi:hypothetical protein